MTKRIDSEVAWEEALQRQIVAPWVGELPPAAVAAAALETGTPFGSHAFAEHRRCGRAFQLARSGIVPVERLGFSKLDYFTIGGLVHATLAYAWGAFREGNYAIDPLDAIRARTQIEEIGEAEYDEATRLVGAYFAHYGFPDFGSLDGGPGERFEYVAVEELLEEPAAFVLPYTARLDLIGRVDGELVIVDTKTRKAKLPEGLDLDEYQFKLRANPQFLGQAFLAMKRFGLAEPPRVIVNAIVKTKVPGFGRVSVRFAKADVERWAENHAREARETRLADNRMNYSACAPAIGSACRYLHYCHGSDEQRARRYTQRDTAAIGAAEGIEE